MTQPIEIKRETNDIRNLLKKVEENQAMRGSSVEESEQVTQRRAPRGGFSGGKKGKKAGNRTLADTKYHTLEERNQRARVRQIEARERAMKDAFLASKKVVTAVEQRRLNAIEAKVKSCFAELQADVVGNLGGGDDAYDSVCDLFGGDVKELLGKDGLEMLIDQSSILDRAKRVLKGCKPTYAADQHPTGYEFQELEREKFVEQGEASESLVEDLMGFAGDVHDNLDVAMDVVKAICHPEQDVYDEDVKVNPKDIVSAERPVKIFREVQLSLRVHLRDYSPAFIENAIATSMRMCEVVCGDHSSLGYLVTDRLILLPRHLALDQEVVLVFKQFTVRLSHDQYVLGDYGNDLGGLYLTKGAIHVDGDLLPFGVPKPGKMLIRLTEQYGYTRMFPTRPVEMKYSGCDYSINAWALEATVGGASSKCGAVYIDPYKNEVVGMHIGSKNSMAFMTPFLMAKNLYVDEMPLEWIAQSACAKKLTPRPGEIITDVVPETCDVKFKNVYLNSGMKKAIEFLRDVRQLVSIFESESSLLAVTGQLCVGSQKFLCAAATVPEAEHACWEALVRFLVEHDFDLQTLNVRTTECQTVCRPTEGSQDLLDPNKRVVVDEIHRVGQPIMSAQTSSEEYLYTQEKKIPRILKRVRPPMPRAVLTADYIVRSQLTADSTYWGVLDIITAPLDNTITKVQIAVSYTAIWGYVSGPEFVAITVCAGSAFGPASAGNGSANGIFLARRFGTGLHTSVNMASDSFLFEWVGNIPMAGEDLLIGIDKTAIETPFTCNVDVRFVITPPGPLYDGVKMESGRPSKKALQKVGTGPSDVIHEVKELSHDRTTDDGMGMVDQGEEGVDCLDYPGTHPDIGSIVGGQTMPHWEKNFELGSFEWKTTDALHASIGFLQLPSQYFTNFQDAILKAANSAYIQLGFELTAVLAGPSTVSGQLIMFCSPGARVPANSYQALSGPHVVMDAGSKSAGQLDVPYVRDTHAILTDGLSIDVDHLFDFATVGINVLSPLVSTVATATVDVRLYCRLTLAYVQYGGITSFAVTSSNHRNEKLVTTQKVMKELGIEFCPECINPTKDGYCIVCCQVVLQGPPKVIAEATKKTAGAVARTGHAVKGVHGVLETGGGLVGDALDAMSLSKPTAADNAVAVVPRSAPNMCYAQGTDFGQSMSLYPDAKTVLSAPEAGMRDGDPMDLDTIAGRYGYVGSFTYASTSLNGDKLWQCNVGMMCPPVSGGLFQMPPATYLLSHFEWWRAVVRVKITLVKNGFHAGILRVCCRYSGEGVMSSTTEALTHNVVWDIAANGVLTVDIPFCHYYHFRRTRLHAQGVNDDLTVPTLYLIAKSPLQTSSTISPQSITGRVEMCMYNVEVMQPTLKLLNSVPGPTPEKSHLKKKKKRREGVVLLEERKVELQGPYDNFTHAMSDEPIWLGPEMKVMPQKERAARYAGCEYFTSIRPLFKRFQYMSSADVSGSLTGTKLVFDLNASTMQIPAYFESLFHLFVMGYGGWNIKMVPYDSMSASLTEMSFNVALLHMPTTGPVPGAPVVIQSDALHPIIELNLPRLSPQAVYILGIDSDGNRWLTDGRAGYIRTNYASYMMYVAAADDFGVFGPNYITPRYFNDSSMSELTGFGLLVVP